VPKLLSALAGLVGSGQLNETWPKRTFQGLSYKEGLIFLKESLRTRTRTRTLTNIPAITLC